ncbi:hypothetical protein Pint_29246 [Pistacia integerrima]|uniref:Uncharacterized protein n=1 Tax=Pistacia integerrima TaxID=434235 RepID=A0ACC0X132_9ROSI|nr:hypothetical protein Pint_29246 [Pistacia integerrima]
MVNQRLQPEEENQPHFLVQAYGIDLTKRLFLDSTLTVREKEETHSIFKQLSFKNAFQVVEIELALIYDLMYTKAPLLYTPWGLCLRLITFFLTFITLLLFIFLVEKHSFTKADLLITFFLLVGGISLEIYAALMLIFSDRFFLWFNMQKKNWAIFQTINSLPPPKNRRWSNKMTQYSLIKFSLKEKPMPCRNLFKLLNIEFKIEKWRSASQTQVSEDLKKLIFRYFKKKAARMEEEVFVKILPTAKAVAGASEELEKGDPIIKEDLGKRILFWHIVTDVWYNLDRGDSETKQEFVAIKVHCKLIKQISRYMLYLLVVHPAMVSIGLAQTSFQDISAVVTDIASPARVGQSKGYKQGWKRNIDKTAASKRLADSYFLGLEGVLGEALDHIQKMRHEEKVETS